MKKEPVPKAGPQPDQGEGGILPVSLRLAMIEDARLLFDWRNDPATRLMFFNTAAVGWDEHVQWLSRRLSGGADWFFIAQSGSHDVGYVRFDEKLGGDLEVSIAIAADWRGHALAKPALAASCAAVRKESPERLVVAQVKTDNVASQRLFIACGFRRTGQSDGLVHFVLPPIARDELG